MNHFDNHFSREQENTLSALADALKPMQLEARIDGDMVSIPVTRFEELIEAETELRIIQRARNNDQYEHTTEAVMRSVFGPKAKKEDNDA